MSFHFMTITCFLICKRDFGRGSRFRELNESLTVTHTYKVRVVRQVYGPVVRRWPGVWRRLWRHLPAGPAAIHVLLLKERVF